MLLEVILLGNFVGILQYTMQLVLSSLFEIVAAELDEELWMMFESTIGFTVPQG